MNLLDYQYRIDTLDTLLNKISMNMNIKFVLLSCIHYSILAIFIYYNLFFSNNIYVFSLSYFLLIFQVILNLWDNGCFMMKLERKYIGDWWFGPYTLLNYIMNDVINKDTCSISFKFISFITSFYGLYRLYNYYNGRDFII